MQLLRFRIWNGQAMYPVHCITWQQYDNRRISQVKADTKDGVIEVLPGNNGIFEIVQFIGAYDRRGREIYEGDVLQLDDKGTIGLVCPNLGGGWYIASDSLLVPYIGNTEVIGNRYQNPELITWKV